MDESALEVMMLDQGVVDALAKIRCVCRTEKHGRILGCAESPYDSPGQLRQVQRAWQCYIRRQQAAYPLPPRLCDRAPCRPGAAACTCTSGQCG